MKKLLISLIFIFILQYQAKDSKALKRWKKKHRECESELEKYERPGCNSTDSPDDCRDNFLEHIESFNYPNLNSEVKFYVLMEALSKVKEIKIATDHPDNNAKKLICWDDEVESREDCIIRYEGYLKNLLQTPDTSNQNYDKRTNTERKWHSLTNAREEATRLNERLDHLRAKNNEITKNAVSKYANDLVTCKMDLLAAEKGVCHRLNNENICENPSYQDMAKSVSHIKSATEIDYQEGNGKDSIIVEVRSSIYEYGLR